MNTTAQKNELILSYSGGILGDAKSLLVSMYLHLNSVAFKNSVIELWSQWCSVRHNRAPNRIF